MRRIGTLFALLLMLAAPGVAQLDRASELIKAERYDAAEELMRTIRDRLQR